jgi:Mg2+/Co2+ transporter CorB
MSTALELAAPGIVAMAGLILASCFFSASETALFYLSRDELRRFRIGSPRERAAAALLADGDRLLTAVLFWQVILNLLYFAVGVVVAQHLVASGESALAGAFGLASLFTFILFAEVLPKSVAVLYRRAFAALLSWPLAAAVRLVAPVLPILQSTSLIARRAFWPSIGREPYLEAEDLERAVEATHLSQQVIQHERQVLHNILDLSEVTVEEVMRPRGTYVALSPPVHLSDLKGEVPLGDFVAILELGTENIDSVVPLAGFPFIPAEHLEQVAEDVVNVPWCATLANTLQLLRDRVSSVATVVNEYGETIGVVAYEDIIDSVLTAQPSRAKRLYRREPVIEVGPGKYEVEGITTIRFLCRYLGIEYEPAAEALVTVAGMLHEELEHLPVAGDRCQWRGYTFEVVEATNRGRLRAILTTSEVPTGAEPTEGN